VKRDNVVRTALVASAFFLMVIGGARPSDAAEPGVLEGHLTITSLKQVERDDASPSKVAAVDYAAYPLLILSKDGKTTIREIAADKDGNYRVSLPSGDYVLDAKGRAPRRVRAKRKSFTVISHQTVRVDFDLDTGIR
jgi:hypothetical protein